MTPKCPLTEFKNTLLKKKKQVSIQPQLRFSQIMFSLKKQLFPISLAAQH